jgi:hypothetical protein
MLSILSLYIIFKSYGNGGGGSSSTAVPASEQSGATAVVVVVVVPGQLIVNCQAVPGIGAYTSTRADVGLAKFLLNDVIPPPGLVTLGYPSSG